MCLVAKTSHCQEEVWNISVHKYVNTTPMHLVYFLISTRGIQIRRPICVPLHLRHDLTRDHLRQVLIEGGRTPMSILSPTPGTNAVRFLWRPIVGFLVLFWRESNLGNQQRSMQHAATPTATPCSLNYILTSTTGTLSSHCVKFLALLPFCPHSPWLLVSVQSVWADL